MTWLLNTKGDLVLIGLSVLMGYLLAQFKVLKLQDKLPKRGANGRFTKKYEVNV